MGWSPHIHTRFHVPRATLDTASLTRFSHTGLSPSMVCFFQNTSTKLIKSIMQSEPCMYYYLQFGLFLFRSPLLQESNIFFLFLWVLRCFSSPRSLLIYYFTHIWILRLFALSEFPHSDISGLMDICSYPKLFAAYHVLLRLLVPSYSPYALCSLTLFSLLIINMFNIISIINRFNCILQFLTTI